MLFLNHSTAFFFSFLFNNDNDNDNITEKSIYLSIKEVIYYDNLLLYL